MVLGNLQCLGVLQIWIIVGQRLTVLAGCACEEFIVNISLARLKVYMFIVPFAGRCLNMDC